MATSLGQLLDTLAETARVTEVTPAARADAGIALGHMGRALSRLRTDGISPIAGDRREQQVAALTAACSEMAARAPTIELGLTRLAAAAADTVGVLREQGGLGSRWAATVALADAIPPLIDLVAQGVPAGPAAEWLAAVRRRTVRVQQTAALQPPRSCDAVLLDHPLPDPTVSRAFGRGSDPAVVVTETVAVLLRATARGADPPSVSEVLAFSLGAETLCRAAEALPPGGWAEDGLTATAAPSQTWRAVRMALRPFDDGSRRPHRDAEAAVQAAGRLYAVLRRAEEDPATYPASLRNAVAAAAQHLPALARQLDSAVGRWAATGAVLAHACDLPPRDERLPAQLAAHRPAGLVRVDALDLWPVVDALANARVLSVAVAAGAADVAVRDDPRFPRRSWVAHRAQADRSHPRAELSEDNLRAYRQLQAVRHRPPGPGRAR